MKVEVVMPKMGESLQEGTIIKWLKGVGEQVDRDEMILEISTDKVDTEVPSPVAGVIKEILAEENQTIEVGEVIAMIETDAEEEAAEQPETVETTSEEPDREESAGDSEVVDVVMPKMGESLQEGTIVKWLKEKGEKVDRDEMILEISTDKVDTEVPSPVAGTLVELLAEEGQTIEVGEVIAKIATGAKAAAPAKKTPQKKQETDKQEEKPAPQPVQGGTKEIPRKKDGRFYSPLVRTIAEENNITLEELEKIEGSGMEGRVTKDDLLGYINRRGQKPASAPKAEKKAVEETRVVPAAGKPGPPAVREKADTVHYGNDVEVIPMDRVRSLIAEHMVFSKRTSAHVYSVGEADVTGIVKFREKHKDAFLRANDIKLTFTPFFARAVVDAIKEHPMVNVSVDGKNIIRHRRINLGIATALDDGNLIVPVVKDADNLSLTGMARSITDLANRARTKKLNPDDIQGGTFSLTNFGTFGTLFGMPVINQPQTAIIGIGSIKKRPVVKEVDGEHLVVVRDMAYISITFDHRVIDGMLGGMALEACIRSLESMNENTIEL